MDLSQWTSTKLMDALTLRARRWASAFSVFMAAVFVAATAIYAGVRGYDAATSPAATVLTSQNVPSMALATLTICPMYSQASIAPAECVLEYGTTLLADCLAQVHTVQVVIEQVSVNCLQFNNPAGGAPFVATSPASELGTRTVVDFLAVPPGEPLGAYAIVHAQNVAPAFGWDHVFIADPGDVTLVLLKNTTNVAANGTSSVEFSISVSNAATSSNDTTSRNTVDIDVIYPEMISYYNTEVPIYVKHNWLGEVGGLAALLYFLHSAIMWPLLCLLYNCGFANGTRKGMAYQVEDS